MMVQTYAHYISIHILILSYSNSENNYLLEKELNADLHWDAVLMLWHMQTWTVMSVSVLQASQMPMIGNVLPKPK